MADHSDLKNPNPIVPRLLEGEHTFSFRCHKNISCWNACCNNIDIALTPYDIIRLKQRLGMKSWEFLREYTTPYEFEKDGIAGVKLMPVEGGTACRFMNEEGCSRLHRPPDRLSLLPGRLGVNAQTGRIQRPPVLRHGLRGALQGASRGEPDDHRSVFAPSRAWKSTTNTPHGWRQLVLKKKSSGATIGKPSLKSRRLFFMANYDIDRFREFVRSEGFTKSFVIEDELFVRLMSDDVELMEFGYRLLQQVLFGEESIPMREEAINAQLEKFAGQAEQRQHEKEKVYNPAAEPLER